MTQDEEIRRADEASLLMQHPLMAEAFTMIEAGLVDALKRADLRDRDMQHEVVLSLQLLNRLQGHFREVMTTGKMARIQRDTMAQKVRKVFRAA